MVPGVEEVPGTVTGIERAHARCRRFIPPKAYQSSRGKVSFEEAHRDRGEEQGGATKRGSSEVQKREKQRKVETNIRAHFNSMLHRDRLRYVLRSRKLVI